VIQQVLKTDSLHRRLQHGGIAIAQNAGGNALRLEPLQHRQVFREGAQVLVLV